MMQRLRFASQGLMYATPRRRMLTVAAPCVSPYNLVRKQIQHMIKYRYVPFSFGKARYTPKNNS